MARQLPPPLDLLNYPPAPTQWAEDVDLSRLIRDYRNVLQENIALRQRLMVAAQDKADLLNSMEAERQKWEVQRKKWERVFAEEAASMKDCSERLAHLASLCEDLTEEKEELRNENLQMKKRIAEFQEHVRLSSKERKEMHEEINELRGQLDVLGLGEIAMQLEKRIVRLLLKEEHVFGYTIRDVLEESKSNESVKTSLEEFESEGVISVPLGKLGRLCGGLKNERLEIAHPRDMTEAQLRVALEKAKPEVQVAATTVLDCLVALSRSRGEPH